MLEAFSVVFGSLRPLVYPLLLNLFYFMTKGAPYAVLYVLIRHLLEKGKVSGALGGGILAVMAGVAMLQVMAGIAVHRTAYRTAFQLTAEARLRLADHLRKLSMGFFRDHDPGEVSSLLLQDMEKCEHVFSHFFIDFVAAFFFPLLLLLGFWFLNPRLTCILAAGLTLALPMLFFARRLVGRMGERQIAAMRQMVDAILEYVEGIRVLKSLNCTGSSFIRLDAAFARLKKRSLRLEAAGALPVGLYQMLLELAFPLMLFSGGWMFVEGELSLVVFAAFLVIAYRCIEPLQTAGSFTAELRYMRLGAERIARVMETQPLPMPASPKRPKGYTFCCESVCFGYGGQSVLDGVSANFEAGRLTAIVGSSGSGKSSLTRLMARFRDVDSGRITLGGTDIREMAPETLADALSIVFQDVYLFDDTIAANIRLADPTADEYKVRAAAKAACCDFIDDFPLGFDTPVGEGGARLSGGQRQRIAIARAILKDAPVVILDEATAALDPENDALIQQAVDVLVRNRTVIVIAHRLRTVVRAHCIHVLEKGRVVESGSHAELMAAKGRYHSLWEAQEQAGRWRMGREGGGNPPENDVPQGCHVA